MTSHVVVPAQFVRPFDGPVWNDVSNGTYSAFLGRGWTSNGGAARLHPARALPFSLDIDGCDQVGSIRKLILIGVFARLAGTEDDPIGTIGAHLQFLNPEGRIVKQIDFKKGKHYDDAAIPLAEEVTIGDKSFRSPIGWFEDSFGNWRVDALEISIESDLGFDSIKFRDMGTPASFVLFGALYEVEALSECPFRGRGKAISLPEVGGILRLRDRSKFKMAVEQLRTGILRCAPDLDEGRGTGLTFLAVVAAALLELGAPREIHRSQLDAARKFDQSETIEEIADLAEELAYKLSAFVLPHTDDPSAGLLERAVSIIERNYSEDISDAFVAEKLGLSTSHFRHLFRKHTEQPFHKFVIAMRLERAKDLVVSSPMSISEIAQTVGFASAAHFSRVFHQRFSVAPSTLRTSQKITSDSSR